MTSKLYIILHKILKWFITHLRIKELKDPRQKRTHQRSSIFPAPITFPGWRSVFQENFLSGFGPVPSAHSQTTHHQSQCSWVVEALLFWHSDDRLPGWSAMRLPASQSQWSATLYFPHPGIPIPRWLHNVFLKKGRIVWIAGRKPCPRRFVFRLKTFPFLRPCVSELRLQNWISIQLILINSLFNK